MKEWARDNRILCHVNIFCSLQVLQHLNVFDEGDLDAAAEALDDVTFFLEFLIAVQSEP